MSDDNGPARDPQRLKYGGSAGKTSKQEPCATENPLKRSCSERETVATN